MSRPSGSRTALGLACLWPWHPEAQPWPEDRPGPAAERGSRMHARAAALLAADAPQVPALDAVGDLLETHPLAERARASVHAAAETTRHDHRSRWPRLGVQLSDWITKMQPHFVAVWVHQAWNLSYNISVKFPDPNDRWFWVYRGIELLRDAVLIASNR